MGITGITVTGDIGAGKSTASKILSRLTGCPVIDADVIAAGIWKRPEVWGIAAERWGVEEVNKTEISRHIFFDEDENKFCNALIHPLVMNEILERTKNISFVAEIPLLPEAGRPDWAGRVIFVTASFESRAERCRVSRGWSYDELKRREKFLLPQNVRKSVADYVIENESSLSELENKIVNFLQEKE